MSLWSPPSCGEVLTQGKNRTGQGTCAAGGGAPGWRPRPFGLVGAGLGAGVGRRGENMREKEKNGIEPYVYIPPGGFEPPSPDPKSCMIDRYTTGVGNDLL